MAEPLRRNPCKCCVMLSHFKPDTRQNRAAWVICGASFVIGMVMVPLGASQLDAATKSYNDCLNTHGITPESDYHGTCDANIYSMMNWYRVFFWGFFFFCISMGCLCYFWCCATPAGYVGGAAGYAVTGHSVMLGTMPGHMVEAQPLFHPGMQYSNNMQYNNNMQYGNNMQYSSNMTPGVMPPAYQFAQMHPVAPMPGYTMPNPQPVMATHVPTYTVTIGHDSNYGAQFPQPSYGTVSGHQNPVEGAPSGLPVALASPANTDCGSTHLSTSREAHLGDSSGHEQHVRGVTAPGAAYSSLSPRPDASPHATTTALTASSQTAVSAAAGNASLL